MTPALDIPAAVPGPLALLADRRTKRAPKRAAQVATRIEADILEAGWPIGTVMGSEPELAARYGVSQAVLREALCLVEHHRVAKMRRGRHGGLVIRAPDPTIVALAATYYLEWAGTQNLHVHDTRLVVEPFAAALAAERITEDGIRRLREILARPIALDESLPAAAFIEEHDRLHHEIAALTGNPALVLFGEILTQLSVRYNEDLTSAEIAAAAGEAQASRAALAEAVMTGDPGLAAHCAIAHLDVIGAWLQPRPDRATRHRRVEVDRDDRPERVHIERLGPYKLAEVVAAEIHRDITRRGHPLGEVIGSEHDLLAHYGVSRAVLREAVRILEHHSIALMRPGPGGGLVVDEPDPTAFTDAMVLYLEYEKVGADALGEARAAIELGCIDHVVDSITPDGLVWLRETPTVGDLESIEPGNVAAEDLHLRLAALTQNPILAMFVSSLASIAERRAAQARTSGDARACLAEHAGIVAAIGQRDRSLARNRMLRHLRSLERRRRGSIA